MGALILAVFGVPLALALVASRARNPARVPALLPWATLPALLLALSTHEPPTFELPSILTGVQLGLDATGRAFLFFSALIWLAAGWSARAWLAGDPHPRRFTVFFLLAMAGNFGACVALDAGGFYASFALMSLAAYGLVAHDASAPAQHAGRIYLAFALAGEMLILAGLLAGIARTPADPLAVVCIVLGFGAKTGLPLLHVSLPLAYAAAPPPAAAALAGAMIKIGLLGWMRFLPLGTDALPGIGSALMLAGGVAIVYASAAGLTQRQPGALLAYSSISQMGHITLGIGAALFAPQLWPVLAAALTLYATHHALAKAALFLGLGVAQQRGATPWVMTGLALPAFALAGAPLTSGMAAKLDLKGALAGLPAPWADAVPWLLAFGALGTALLMLRGAWLLRHTPTQTVPGRELALPWLLLLACIAALGAGTLWQQGLRADDLPGAAVPVVLALLLAIASMKLRLRAPDVPPGDLLVPLARLGATLSAVSGRITPPAVALPVPHALRRAAPMERRLRTWPVAGMLWLLFAGSMLALLVA